MKCMSMQCQYHRNLLSFHLLALLCCLHHDVYASVARGVHASNCHDSYNGFNVQPTNMPPALPSLPATGQIPDASMTMTPIAESDASAWKCCCWNETNQNEVECRCEGQTLTRVPQNLKLPIHRLTIASAGLPRLRSTGLKVYGATLLDVAFTDCLLLEGIQDGAFANLTYLRTIYISHAPKLTFLSRNVFEGISETIENIRIINSGLTCVPDLTHLPPYNILQMIDLDNNQISRIETKSIRVKTAQLILANNDISYIDDSAFSGSKIAKLSLKDNRNLKELHPNAFFGITDITELDLSSTSLVRLPSAGLRTIEALYIENTHTLKTIPSIYYFQNLQRAYLTFSFHCCAFQFPSRHDPQRHAQRMQELEKLRAKCHSQQEARHQQFGQFGTTTPDSAEYMDMTNVYYSRLERTRFVVNSIDENSSVLLLRRDELITKPALSSYDDMTDATINNIGFFHEQITINPDDEQLAEYCGNFTLRKPNIECYPLPNALNPCEDVMGYQWLRIAVWIVVALAVVGNVAVLTVILSIKTETSSVPRFLICHLAFADLCLGLYLLLIASIDAHSMGAYFNYAYDWQYGAGCKIAGFLTVFASHLSVFTLTIITIERWLAITHALYLNKRIKLRPAAYIMVAGWIYSILMSSLPLFGISNYSSTSICLPMEDRDAYDTAYLIMILGSNGMAFFIIAICYAQIYLSLGRETRHARQNIPGEMSIAKKMALLVFTNFACWAPIAFFGLTALAGLPLINVTKSKILLVFFYPLNSCADPYLYAILTSQYRQDLFILLAKLGLCRQSVLKYKHSDSLHGTSHFTIQASLQRHNSITSKAHKSLAAETQCMLKSHEDYV